MNHPCVSSLVLALLLSCAPFADPPRDPPLPDPPGAGPLLTLTVVTPADLVSDGETRRGVLVTSLAPGGGISDSVVILEVDRGTLSFSDGAEIFPSLEVTGVALVEVKCPLAFEGILTVTARKSSAEPGRSEALVEVPCVLPTAVLVTSVRSNDCHGVRSDGLSTCEYGFSVELVAPGITRPAKGASVTVTSTLELENGSTLSPALFLDTATETVTSQVVVTTGDDGHASVRLVIPAIYAPAIVRLDVVATTEDGLSHTLAPVFSVTFEDDIALELLTPAPEYLAGHESVDLVVGLTGSEPVGPHEGPVEFRLSPSFPAQLAGAGQVASTVIVPLDDQSRASATLIAGSVTEERVVSVQACYAAFWTEAPKCASADVLLVPPGGEVSLFTVDAQASPSVLVSSLGSQAVVRASVKTVREGLLQDVEDAVVTIAVAPESMSLIALGSRAAPYFDTIEAVGSDGYADALVSTVADGVEGVGALHVTTTVDGFRYERTLAIVVRATP